MKKGDRIKITDRSEFMVGCVGTILVQHEFPFNRCFNVKLDNYENVVKLFEDQMELVTCH